MGGGASREEEAQKGLDRKEVAKGIRDVRSKQRKQRWKGLWVTRPTRQENWARENKVGNEVTQIAQGPITSLCTMLVSGLCSKQREAMKSREGTMVSWTYVQILAQPPGSSVT